MENKHNKKRVLIYVRVSAKDQKYESQIHRCQEHAKRKEYEIEQIFKDKYTGGGDFMKRPAMAEMIAYIDSKPYNQYIVLFDDLKRFARDTKFHLELRSALKIRNVTPECLNFKFEDTPEGRYVETILAAGAELEREQNKRQVIQKQKACLEAGRYAFGGKKSVCFCKILAESHICSGFFSVPSTRSSAVR